MKKFVALLMALVLVLSMSAALAETRSYFMAAASDADGNAIDLVTNADMFPALAFVIDDETMTCAFGTDEEYVEGIVGEPELIDEENGVAVMHIVLDDGTEYDLIYAAYEDTFYFTDPESGVTFGLINADILDEVA